MTGISAFLTQKGAQLAAAVADPAEGVTIRVTFEGIGVERVADSRTHRRRVTRDRLDDPRLHHRIGRSRQSRRGIGDARAPRSATSKSGASATAWKELESYLGESVRKSLMASSQTTDRTGRSGAVRT